MGLRPLEKRSGQTMVYLEELAKKYKGELLADGSIQAICYFYVADKQNLPKDIDPNFGDEETLAAKVTWE